MASSHPPIPRVKVEVKANKSSNGASPRQKDAWSQAKKLACGRLADKWRGSSDEAAIPHAKRVADRVRNSFGVREGKVCVVALLHDILEDTETSVDEITESFGREVADSVLLLTKPEFGPKSFRRDMYLKALASGSDTVRFVKLADYLDNIESRRSKVRKARSIRSATLFLSELRRYGLSLRMARAAGMVEDACNENATPTPAQRDSSRSAAIR